MSALRDLVAGQGCESSGGGPNKNPLASLFDSLLHKNQTTGQDGMFRASSGVPGAPDIQMDRSKIRNRATVVTRHMFPGTSCKPAGSGWILALLAVIFVCFRKIIQIVVHVSCQPDVAQLE
jgi:hypothetical protein